MQGKSGTSGNRVRVFTVLRPEGRQQNHPIQSRTSKETLPVGIESTETPDVWSKLRRQSWARLLQKVYEVDPFVCLKRQGTMTVVAVIEKPTELTRIIEWAKRQEGEPSLPVCARSPPELVPASL